MVHWNGIRSSISVGRLPMGCARRNLHTKRDGPKPTVAANYLVEHGVVRKRTVLNHHDFQVLSPKTDPVWSNIIRR